MMTLENGNNTRNPGILGHSFERQVLDAFESNGFVRVRKNQWKRNYDFASDSAKKREYDLVFYNPSDSRVYIIECKAHFSKETPTGMDEVREFAAKLKNYNGQYAYPIIITDSYFSRQARAVALESRIAMMDGENFKVFESQGSLVKKMKSKVYGAALGSAEKALEALISKCI